MPDKTDGDGAASAALSRFITERVGPLAKAFASTPLMELRVRTPEGFVRLVKSADGHAQPRVTARAPSTRHTQKASLVPSTQEGHPYEVIAADVVGIFRSAADVPLPGAHIESGQTLGSIEALRLKHPVRNVDPAIMIAQVVEDGQPVDFGEALFVVDRSDSAKAQMASQASQPAELLEPPRL